jgi:hypothetical protein
MINESNAPISVATHKIASVSNIYHSNLGKNLRDKLLNGFQRLDTEFNEGEQQDNLHKTARTDWDAHRDPDVQEVLQAIMRLLCHSMTQSIDTDYQLHMDCLCSWITLSKEGAVVEPHYHNPFELGWSFAFYAKIPSGSTTLTFFDGLAHIKSRAVCNEGDVLMFPSSLYHYTTDTEVDRVVYSGNLLAGAKQNDGTTN